MKHFNLLIGVCFALSMAAQVEDTGSLFFSKYILAESLKKNLTVLASDEYEGRETGQKGQKMAAEFIMNHFKSNGFSPLPKLENGFYQSFPLSVYDPQVLEIKNGTRNYNQLKDYYSYSTIIKDTFIKANEIVFAGYGINTLVYNDFENNNVKDKVVLIMDSEPYREDKTSIVSGKTTTSDWTTNYRLKLYEAKKQGIKILLVADKNLDESFKVNEHRITSKKMNINEKGKEDAFAAPLVIYISEKMANELIGSKKRTLQKLSQEISKKGKSKSFSFKCDLSIDVKQKKVNIGSENVLAYLEGSDKKDELIVITAHYDHLGKHDGVVYNGADDDGSGTVAVMELAKAFAIAKKEGKGPRRSILFMTVAGEEKGLLGSEYYTNNPVFPLANTVCDLNIDMIGRLDEAHKNNPNYIYLIGSDKISKDLHQLSESINKKYSGLQLDYTYNSDTDPNRYYYRSDHYNFAKNNVPVIFYFNGVHADYHQETDEVQKIDFEKMQKITRLVFLTAWEIANRESRLIIDK